MATDIKCKYCTNKGIDISCWQEGIDLTQAKANGIEFAILRDGFGTTEDSCYMEFGKQAKAAGLDIPGIYHFSYATSDKEAKAEGRFAVMEARRLGLPSTTIIFYDFEYESLDYCERKGVEVDPKTLCRWTTLFLEEIKKGGYIPGIYLNYDFLNRFYSREFIEPYAVWIAYWTDSDKPDIDYDYWQTGSDYGIGGLSSNVDTNFKGNRIKIEETVSNKTTNEIVDEVIAGKWGNGNERYNRLIAAGYDYQKIQAAVNDKLASPKKSIEEIAKEVVIGDWGNGLERIRRLKEAGYDPAEVQEMVNRKYY